MPKFAPITKKNMATWLHDNGFRPIPGRPLTYKHPDGYYAVYRVSSEDEESKIEFSLSPAGPFNAPTPESAKRYEGFPR